MSPRANRFRTELLKWHFVGYDPRTNTLVPRCQIHMTPLGTATAINKGT